MRQRFEIAKAFSFEPSLVLLDEAFSGIDAAAKADVFAFIDEQMQGAKTSVLFVTHDLGDVIRLSDSVLLIEAGRVIGRHDPGTPRSQRLVMSGGSLIELGIAKKLAAELF
jgi:ABC-type multidrug transport system ATPase subunit